MKIMSQAERQDLLLHFLQGKFVIIPHTEIFLGLFVLLSRNMNRAVIMMGQASGNERCITFVRFHFFLASRFWHRCRRKDDTFHTVVCKLVIEGKAETSSLITAYKCNIVSVVETHCFQIVEHFAVVPIHFLAVLCKSFLVCITTKRKFFFMNIHSYVNCVIIHLMTSICMR